MLQTVATVVAVILGAVAIWGAAWKALQWIQREFKKRDDNISFLESRQFEYERRTNHLIGQRDILLKIVEKLVQQDSTADKDL